MTALERGWINLAFLLGSIVLLEPLAAGNRTRPEFFDPDQKLPRHSLQSKTDTLLESLFRRHPSFFDSVQKNRKELNVQVIYTQIDRDKKGTPRFTDHRFNTEDPDYFYPASTVKLPIAALALQKLNELNIAGLDRNSTMITGSDGDNQTEVWNDPSAPDGRPTIAHYIKKILLVSDNDAFNRLYEFLGQEYINHSLHQMGYEEAQIIHRLNIFLTEAENRHTNPVRFVDSSGRVLYNKPAELSQLIYRAGKNSRDSCRIGKGYMKGEELIPEPFDFSKKNRLSLSSLHQILKSILFPESVPPAQRFHLTKEDYGFLRRYMSMLPPESRSPVYDTSEYGRNYVKFLYYGGLKDPMEKGFRIFNKTGDAYGFMIDAAYFADFERKREFLLSAVIYCNKDGIINDDRYDYDSVGRPFMRNLGRIIYEYELRRSPKHPPDLSGFVFSYRD